MGSGHRKSPGNCSGGTSCFPQLLLGVSPLFMGVFPTLLGVFSAPFGRVLHSFESVPHSFSECFPLLWESSFLWECSPLFWKCSPLFLRMFPPPFGSGPHSFGSVPHSLRMFPTPLGMFPTPFRDTCRTPPVFFTPPHGPDLAPSSSPDTEAPRLKCYKTQCQSPSEHCPSLLLLFAPFPKQFGAACPALLVSPQGWILRSSLAMQHPLKKGTRHLGWFSFLK